MEVLGDFLMFTLVYNDGGAMGTNFGSPLYYAITSSLILCFVIVYAYLNRSQTWIVVPLGFVAGGAVGNLIDRIRFGKVIDFIDVEFFNIDFLGIRLDRWWTFNVADIGISCGIVLMLILILFGPTPDSDKRKQSVAAEPAVEN